MTLAMDTWPFLVILYVFSKTMISVAGDSLSKVFFPFNSYLRAILTNVHNKHVTMEIAENESR